MTFADNGTYSVNNIRTSSSAFINRRQTPIVECIERRFAQFQGDIDVECIEPLQVVKYTPNQQVWHNVICIPDSTFRQINSVKVGENVSLR
jgi:hypothetical protein